MCRPCFVRIFFSKSRGPCPPSRRPWTRDNVLFCQTDWSRAATHETTRATLLLYLPWSVTDFREPLWVFMASFMTPRFTFSGHVLLAWRKWFANNHSCDFGNRAIHVFDDLFTDEELSAWRSHVLKSKVQDSPFDSAPLEDHDNVKWMATYPVKSVCGYFPPHPLNFKDFPNETSRGKLYKTHPFIFDFGATALYGITIAWDHW